MKIKKEDAKLLADQAYRNGYDYLPRWRACAPTVFAAVMDTVGYDGDPVVQEIWKAVIGLTGGTGNMSIGTCGAMAGAAASVSYSFGYSMDDLRDITKMLAVNSAVAEVGEKMKARYGDITCQEVQFKHWGKSFRLTDPRALKEFAALTGGDDARTECREVTGDLARWAVEAIITYNPDFIKIQPPF
ncbi:MAG: hypothetical protein AVO39_11305 [delta proteobacterium MLS_D]|jgi:hypothetical protein|nr:MAG: hypothetical protein AVO39_11305 [delta proteobacterium MLS_D]